MALTETRYEHIILDERGVARIAGTQLRAIDLVEAKRANAWTPEQLHEQHPELTLAACRREARSEARTACYTHTMSRTFKTVDYTATLDQTVRLGDCLPP
ncbi:MAG TPA: hypothetical protein VLA19_22780, partial [Herpetosiphonaceae bacterium]|nr:hypothetical protein [Herpetosiphonaceae bacterium]